MTSRIPASTAATIVRIGAATAQVDQDLVATEEPLTIDLVAAEEVVTVATTMRTPGEDHELAVGWLLAEGVIRSAADVLDVSWCVREHDEPQHRNRVRVTVRGELPEVARGLARVGVRHAGCGVCGQVTIDDLAARDIPRVTAALAADAATLLTLPAALRRAQAEFRSTGGLHAAGLFDAAGTLLAVREDVGRHNALDKLIGAAALQGDLPFSERILLLSGRASFELLQKAAVAGVPLVAAIGAPSSLAIAVAERFGITLVGFLRDDRANVYAHPQRVLTGAPA